MNLDLQHLGQSPFVIVAISVDEEGNEDVYAADGKAIYNAATNTIDIFREGVDEPLLILQEEDFDEIQIADEEEKEELGADYYIVVDIDPTEAGEEA